MSSAEIVSEVLTKVDSRDWDGAAVLLDADFEFVGPTPKPANAAEFIAFQKAVHAGFPDFRHNHRIYSEDGDWVRGEVRVRGTHTQTLSVEGLPPIEPTGRYVENPTERFLALVKDGKLTHLAVEVTPDGGFAGLLRRIGRADLADRLIGPAAGAAAPTEAPAVMLALARALDDEDFDRAAGLLDDGVSVSGRTESPMGKADFIAMQRTLRSAFPKMRSNLLVCATSGERVIGVMNLAGKHLGPLPLPAGETLAPTGRSFRLPTDCYTALVRNGKVISIAVKSARGGGVEGIVRQLTGKAKPARAAKSAKQACEACASLTTL
jgi:ketosteroid isomerase-like protein